MDADDNDTEPNDFQRYRPPDAIAQSELREALCGLTLFGSDPNFRSQAFNVALVDEFVMKLELDLLRQQFREERTPIPEAMFVSAQSQMWIFAAYELMRTWRQRAKDMIKWANKWRPGSETGASQKEDSVCSRWARMASRTNRQLWIPL